MEPYQERIVAEKDELDAKRMKLAEFMRTPAWHAVDGDEQARMRRQLDTMTLYSDILGQRIAVFAP